MTDLGNNIIKLEGYGLYATYIDDEYFVSEIVPGTGHPKLDPDGCIDWEKLTEPPNQQFLNILNARFGTSLTLTKFNIPMKIRDIKEYVKAQKDKKSEGMTENSLRWLVKNIRERDK